MNIGARVASEAGPSEVLVSQTVKGLVAGSGLVFEDAGEHDLKGHLGDPAPLPSRLVATYPAPSQPSVRYSTAMSPRSRLTAPPEGLRHCSWIRSAWGAAESPCSTH